jgi:hypothetical protein
MYCTCEILTDIKKEKADEYCKILYILYSTRYYRIFSEELNLFLKPVENKNGAQIFFL